MKTEIEQAFSVGRELFHLNDYLLQREYAERVDAVITCANKNGEGHAFLEAESGVGKTLGYLVPALLHSAHTGNRVVISTYTNHLQRQILAPEGDMERALAMVAAVTGKRLTVARRIGMRNFVDVDKARLKMELARRTFSERAEDFDRFLAWAEASESGDMGEYLEFEGGHLPAHCDLEDLSISARSTSEAKQRYHRHVADAKLADVLITNHSMLVQTARRGRKMLHDEAQRPIGVLLIDECDRLPEAARDAPYDTFNPTHLVMSLKTWMRSREDPVGNALGIALSRNLHSGHRAPVGGPQFDATKRSVGFRLPENRP